VRVAARLARALDAPWHAVLVRTPALDEEAARRAHAHLGLAESLGATVATVASDEVAAALVGYARTHNLHTLVLGSSGGRWWQRTLVDAVSRAAHDLELHIVPGQEPTTTRQRPALPGFWPTARDTAVAGGFVGLATAVGWLLRHLLPESDLLMLYLLVVVVASFRLPRAASLLTALGAVAAFNFFFIEPIFTFAFAERRYLLTFLGLGGLGVVVSTLAARARERAAVAAQRESEARALFALGRALADAGGLDAIAATGAAHVHELLGVDVVVRLVDGPDLRVAAHVGPVDDDPADVATARWVVAHQQPAGPGTDTLPSGPSLVVPLATGGTCHGALGVRAADAGLDDPDRRHLLETLTDQISGALARDALAARSADAVRRADAERTRSSLLSSVSHDLRTPLAGITGAATTLQSEGDRVAPEVRRRLLSQIVDEGWRLERLVNNLLQMSRLDEAVGTTLDWEVAQEVTSGAVARVRAEVGGRTLTVEAADAPILVRCDALLVEQAVVNLLENALRHTTGEVTASVRAESDHVVFAVADRGAGVAPGDAERIFERFVRGGSPATGSGLGLAIVRAVARVHGGLAEVVPRDGGGSVFRVVLPVGGPDRAPLPEVEPAVEVVT
jgi:two-component system sensor histidine kinase KdpD